MRGRAVGAAHEAGVVVRLVAGAGRRAVGVEAGHRPGAAVLQGRAASLGGDKTKTAHSEEAAAPAPDPKKLCCRSVEAPQSDGDSGAAGTLPPSTLPAGSVPTGAGAMGAATLTALPPFMCATVAADDMKAMPPTAIAAIVAIIIGLRDAAAAGNGRSETERGFCCSFFRISTEKLGYLKLG